LKLIFSNIESQYLLRTPVVEKSENDTAINFAIPRFFEDKEYEEYDFSNLTLFIKHDVKVYRRKGTGP
jgi:hypothetical protein